MTAYRLVPIPVGKVLKRSTNPTADIVIERLQGDLNWLLDDDFFQGNTPLSNGDRSQNFIFLHFPGGTQEFDRWQGYLPAVAVRSGHAPRTHHSMSLQGVMSFQGVGPVPDTNGRAPSTRRSAQRLPWPPRRPVNDSDR